VQRGSEFLSLFVTVSFLKVRVGVSLSGACQVAAPKRFIITSTIERALQALRHIAGGITARLARGYAVIGSIFHESRTNARLYGMRDLYGTRGLAIRRDRRSAA
jgi:hypothetical protein